MVLLACDLHMSVLRGSSGIPNAYCAFGSSMAKGIAFDGQYVECAGDVYLLGHGQRLYLPALLRFAASDTLSPFQLGGLNTYAFVAGDPINFVDPSGHVKTLADLVRVGLKNLKGTAKPDGRLITRIGHRAITRHLRKPLYQKALSAVVSTGDIRRVEKQMLQPLLADLDQFATGFQSSQAPAVFWGYALQQSTPLRQAVDLTYSEFRAGKLPSLVFSRDAVYVDLFRLHAADRLRQLDPVVANAINTLELPKFAPDQIRQWQQLGKRWNSQNTIFVPAIQSR